MKTNIKFLIALSVLMFAFLGCGQKKEEEKKEIKTKEHSQIVKLSAESIKSLNLQTETASLRPFAGFITIAAKVVVNQDHEAQIGSLIQGRVHKVYVKIGDFVKAGQTLMTIEGPEVGKLKADFLIAKAALDFKKSNYERQKLLFAEKISAEKALLESQAEYEKALAEFKAEDKKIHSADLSDEDILIDKNAKGHTSGVLPVKSSINGIVVERNVVIGQSVDATTNAFKVVDNSSVWIDGQIHEKDLVKIKPKTTAIFTTTAYKDVKFTGETIYVGHAVDEQSRTITIRSLFNNVNGKLKTQMFGDLKIPVGINEKVITAPEEALFTETDGKYIFVQTSDSTFERRKVIVGASADNRAEIKEGLREGDRIVSKGAFYLKSELQKEEFAGDEH
jgi:membrane fusion protein, heavy metal efflux system